MNITLKHSAVAGIITLLTVVPAIIFEVLKSLNKLTGNLVTYYVIILLISFFSYLIFIYGYVLLGIYSKNSLLKIISIISLIFAFILNGFYIVSVYRPELFGLFFSILVLLLFGILEIIFGISVLKLKGLFGGLAKGAGILLIIVGISFLTVILSILGIILLIPAYILGIMILFKASKKF
ncbi:hypothetical protein HYW21_05535 [Candidatus Woesearchaeota archaeon]|nr:hypothetical protein [Candidatus Woesearchaeota archaeon]